MAQNYKMPIFGPCLTWIIFWRERYKKLKLTDCNQLVVLYKGNKHPFSMLINAEFTDRQTCDFLLTYWDFDEIWLKKLNLPSNQFPRFFRIWMHAMSSMSSSEIYKLSQAVTEKTVAKYGTKFRNSIFLRAIFKLKFLENKKDGFRDFLRDYREDHSLSMCEI